MLYWIKHSYALATKYWNNFVMCKHRTHITNHKLCESFTEYLALSLGLFLSRLWFSLCTFEIIWCCLVRAPFYMRMNMSKVKHLVSFHLTNTNAKCGRQAAEATQLYKQYSQYIHKWNVWALVAFLFTYIHIHTLASFALSLHLYGYVCSSI